MASVAFIAAVPDHGEGDWGQLNRRLVDTQAEYWCPPHRQWLRESCYHARVRHGLQQVGRLLVLGHRGVCAGGLAPCDVRRGYCKVGAVHCTQRFRSAPVPSARSRLVDAVNTPM